MTNLGRILLLLSALVAADAHAKIARFAQVTPDIYRGGQPTELADFEYLKNLGIHTVINLRTTGSDVDAEAKIVTSLGLNIRNYPIDGMSYPEEFKVNAILADLLDPSLLPIFIHCHEGKDRTGLIIGLSRVKFENWRPTDAYDEMLSWGFTPTLTGLKQYFWDHVPRLRFLRLHRHH